MGAIQHLDIIDELVHPDYRYRSPGEELHGRQALKDLLAAYQTAFPDLHLSINEQIVADDKAVILFSLTGTQKNEFMGIPASRSPLTG